MKKIIVLLVTILTMNAMPNKLGKRTLTPTEKTLALLEINNNKLKNLSSLESQNYEKIIHISIQSLNYTQQLLNHLRNKRG